MTKFPACLECGKKGLHYANHPHARGWKDYGYVVCRFCHTRFKVKDKSKAQVNVEEKK